MTTAPLSAIAAWDLPLLRGAVGTLDVVTDRLPAWRARVEAVGRALETAQCWSGPAAAAAADAVLELSTAATAVSRAMGASLSSFITVLARAEVGQEAAAAALATAAAEGVPLDETGRADPALPPSTAVLEPAHAAAVARRAEAATRAEELAAVAREAAAAVGAAAEAADVALLPAGIDERLFWVPLSFVDIVERVPAGVAAPVVPVRPPPAGAAQWWASLSAAEQRSAIAASPEAVGGLDGVPAWARDRANRMLLARALVQPTDVGAGTAAVVAAEIERQESAGRPVQLLTLDLGEDVVALAVGDVDTADAVALLVPGIFTAPADDLPGLVADAGAVADRAAAAAPGLAVAAVAWLGYRTPHDPVAIVTRGAARRGGRALDATLDGLAAARTALAAADPRTTVLGHSYGSVVAGEAAAAEGRLAADAVVLLGSPGTTATAAELETSEVYDAASPLDPISYVNWFGPNPWADPFGATELPTDPATLHWQYYDPDRPTLDAVGAVVAGTGPR